MTLEQLKFLLELLSAPGVMLGRERWQIAAETMQALSNTVAAREAEKVAADRVLE